MMRRLIALLLACVLTGASVETAGRASADVAGDAAAAVAHAKASGYRSAISVYDVATGSEWGAGDTTSSYASESVMKLFIATRLLVQGQMTGWIEKTAYLMITQSDDASANALYGRVGGDSVINWVMRYFDLPNLGAPPTKRGWWGQTQITSHGLVAFYNAIMHNSYVWPWLWNAMRKATVYGSDGTFQHFGIPSARSGAGIKQGWGADSSTGTPVFNSTGTVADRYAVAILTQGPGYGDPIANMVTAEAKRLMPDGLISQPRVGTLGSDGSALVKEGALNAPFVTTQATDVTALAQASSRCAVLDANGDVRLKVGDLRSGWTLVATEVKQVVLAGTKIGILTKAGKLLVKEGGLDASWVEEASGVTAFDLDGSRLGVLRSGTLMVKDRDLSLGWVPEMPAVAQFDLNGSRIGAVATDGSVYVKDGDVRASWLLETTAASAVALTSNRVAVLDAKGLVSVKEGDLYASWIAEADNIKSLAVRRDLLGVVRADGTALLKQGDLLGGWITFYPSAGQLSFN